MIRNAADAFNQIQRQPGCRSEYDDEAEHCDDDRRKATAAVQPTQYSFVKRIERDRQNNAPDDDGRKRADQDERDVEQQGQRSDAQAQLDEFLIAVVEVSDAGNPVIHLGIRKNSKGSLSPTPAPNYPSRLNSAAVSLRRRRQNQ